MTCTASDTAVAGQYVNIGTATGMNPAGGATSDQDPSHYYGNQPPPEPSTATSVPTLSEWGIILLSIMLAFLALPMVIRRS